MSETKVPALPSVSEANLAAFARAAKQLLDVREGLVGDPMDANVTFRDLVDAGALVARPGWNGRTGSPVLPVWARPDGYDPTADLLIPPAPTGFTVTSGLAVAILQWDAVPSAYQNHAYAEVWRSETNVIGNAVRIGTSDTRFYSDAIGRTSQTYFYWVRFVSQANVIGPYNALSGTAVSTGMVGGVDLSPLIITADKIASGAIDLGGPKITGLLANANMAVITDPTKIANGLIGNAKLANLAVDAAKLADSAVTATKIANLAVGTAAIQTGAITNALIANAAVGSAQIADAAITSAKIANLAVGNAAIQNLAVTNAKIADLAVDNAKIASLDAAKITTGFLSADRIQAGALDAKIANIDAARITSGIIDAARINSASIANASISAAQIGSGIIDAARISTASISNASVSNAQIINLDASKITSGYISGDRIMANTISAGMIISRSATSFQQTSVGVPNGTWNVVSFFMDHYGYVSVLANINFIFTGSDANWDARIGIDGNSAIASLSGSYFSSAGPPSIGLMGSAWLNAGWHTANVYAFHSLATANQVAHITILRSYR